MQVEEHTLTREELYKELWATPASIVAEKLGTTDVGLGKLCRRHGIPKPGVGYWAKKAAGKKVKQVPLPPRKDRYRDEFRFHKYVYTPEELEEHRRPCRIAPEAERLLEAEERAAPIVLAADLRGCHRTVSKMAKAAKGFRWPRPGPNGEKPRWHQSSSGPLGIRSGKELVRRALLIFDAIFKALEARGQKVTTQSDQWRHDPLLTVLGEEFTLSVYEPCLQQEHVPPAGEKAGWSTQRWDYIPTGDLCFRLYLLGENREEVRWRDRKDSPIETRLNQIVRSIIRRAGRETVLREERAEEERRRWEEQKRQWEEEERQAREQERVNALVAEADAWRQATAVREYIEAVRAVAKEGRVVLEREHDLTTWLTWAEAVAIRLLPTRLTKLTAAGERAPGQHPLPVAGAEELESG